MTKIEFKNKIYPSINSLIGEKNLDIYQIRKYCETKNISKYDFFKEVEKGKLNLDNFIVSQNVLKKLTTKQKENLVYINLKVGKEIEYKSNKYTNLIELLSKNSDKINIVKFINKIITRKSIDKDNVIELLNNY